MRSRCPVCRRPNPPRGVPIKTANGDEPEEFCSHECLAWWKEDHEMTASLIHLVNLRGLHQLVSKKLEGIADLLPEPYRLTLIARHTERPSADIMLTDDDIDKAIEALRALAVDPNATIHPGTNEDLK